MQLDTPINQAIRCFIVPPPEERPHSSWRAIIYTREKPEKVFHGTRTLPSKIVPDPEIMKEELCDPEHIPAFVIQVTDKLSYVYIEGDVCEVIGTEIQMADGHNDPYLRGKTEALPKKKVSSLILPGACQPSGAKPELDLTDAYIVDLTFKTHSVTDPDIIKHVKQIAWNKGIAI